MDLIKAIPVGKAHKTTRKEIMKKANIRNIRTFREELDFLRKRYIILYDDGYYLPASRQEYTDFIIKMQNNIDNARSAIKMAQDEMEELDKV